MLQMPFYMHMDILLVQKALTVAVFLFWYICR